jgi:type II secretory pathway component PulM
MSSSISQFSAYFSRLSSLERRFIIAVIVILFVVINLLFVLPHFNDLGRIKNRFGDANTTSARYNKEIAQAEFYQKNIKDLEGEGAAVPPEDQAVNFLQAINNQAAQSGVGIIANNRQPERTNQFFVERAQALTTQSGEPQLVDFLYSLGAGSSLIRVRALSIRPDVPHTGLNATMTLVASFQKKAPARPAATPVAKPAPATTTPPAAKPATPAVAPVVKTNKPAVTPVTKPSTPTKK